ncbi:MAG: FAD-dependent oxidoreductase [Bacilli bacterium]|nr:FAD-dependent oxidoreductase [Acholeplasmataceae bacterium]
MIIGAGISGLSAAYEALSYAREIVIVDENRIYQGSTASTTAKITVQHGFIFDKLLRSLGKKAAKLYYEYNLRGLKRIEEIVRNERIECDFRKVNSYLFAYREEEEGDVEAEARVYGEIGIPGEIVKIDARISPYKALKIHDQANFNVEKYLRGLTDILLKNGVKIHENTRIVDVYEQDGPEAIIADGHKIKAKRIIIATHYPIYKGFNFYFMKMVPKISYSVLTPPTNLEIEDANYISAGTDPALALRFVVGEGGKMLNISGASHEAKAFLSYNKQLDLLKDFGKKRFEIEKYSHAWCTQDYGCTDDLPLVGRVKEGIYIMAAYNKWGMAASVAGALLIRDLETEKYSKYAELLRPERVKLNAKIFTYNLGMVKTLLKTRRIPKRSILKLAPESGKVARLGSKRVGIYKDKDNRLYLVDVTCPHLRCGLRFNPLEKTYDCKCHGSRFDYTGKLLDGPALRDLYKIEIEDVKKYINL